MKSGVFFERDGILNVSRVDARGPATPLTLDEFKINESSLEPVRRLKEAGFILIATTNQPGLSRGYQSRRELDLMHQLLKAAFSLDDIFICPHDENDRCPCRKPKAGLFLEAAFTHHLDLDHCFIVSDKWQDAQAAHVAGCTSLLVKSPWSGTGHRDFLLPDFETAVQRILQIHGALNGVSASEVQNFSPMSDRICKSLCDMPPGTSVS